MDSKRRAADDIVSKVIPIIDIVVHEVINAPVVNPSIIRQIIYPIAEVVRIMPVEAPWTIVRDKVPIARRDAGASVVEANLPGRSCGLTIIAASGIIASTTLVVRCLIIIVVAHGIACVATPTSIVDIGSVTAHTTGTNGTTSSGSRIGTTSNRTAVIIYARCRIRVRHRAGAGCRAGTGYGT